MKKRITVFVVFIMTMVFCLALTGCGQNTNKQDATTNESHPGENFDTGDSSIMDGTNNPGGIVQSDDDSYADDAAKDREDSSTNNDDNSDTNRNADGTYSWQVGGQTLTTKINVRDYIHGGSWDIKAMSEVLGYSPVEAYGIVDTTHYLNSGSPIADINFETKNSIYGNFYVMTYVSKDSENILSYSVRCGHSGEEYNFGSSDIKVPFELIVAYAYACEHLNEDASTDPFAGVIPGGDSVNGYTLN